MPLKILENDITTLAVDAIVNAANPQLQMGGGVCGAIFRAAGASELQKACDEYGSIETGEAIITLGYNLPSRYIIHTAGPVWQGGEHGEKERLESCYIKSLELAEEEDLQSIAFPVISSGIYGYPKADALDVAVKTISGYFKNSLKEMTVYLVVLNRDGFEIDSDLKADIDKYIAQDEMIMTSTESDHLYEFISNMKRESFYSDDESYDEIETKESEDIPVDVVASFNSDIESYDEIETDDSEDMFSVIFAREEVPTYINGATADEKHARPASFTVTTLDESFSECLRRYVINKNLDDVDVYKRANLTRQHWSKIITHKDYQPSKRTAVALALALELNLDETKDLLLSAGFALSRSYQFDMIIEYFIERRIFDVFEINEVLFKYEQPLLG